MNEQANFETSPREVRKKFQMTNFTMTNNSCSMKDALKPVPGLADVGVPHGDGDGPRTPARCLEGARKKFQMTNFIMPHSTFSIMLNNLSFMKYPLKSVPGLGDVVVLHGDGVGPRTPPRCLEGSGKSFK